MRGHKEEGRGEVSIVQGRRDFDTVRGCEEKYNNQQWLMLMGDGGGQKDGLGDRDEDHGI